MTRGEVWFDDEPDGRRVDWIYHRQRSRPMPGCRSKCLFTRIVELQRSPDELLASMDPKTIAKIREAEEKDRLRWSRLDPRNSRTIDAIEGLWNAFAVAHRTPLLDRQWLEGMIRAGALDLSATEDREGVVLGYHLVLITAKRVRQLIAISPFKAVPTFAWRSAVNRANCFLHWRNFLAYREQGISCFDFGGWHVGKSDIRLLGMNAFKKGFGGKIIQEYECEQPVTFKGWLLLNSARMLEMARQLRPAIRQEPESDRQHALQPEQHKVSPAL